VDYASATGLLIPPLLSLQVEEGGQIVSSGLFTE
jgi:hypothetical protein